MYNSFLGDRELFGCGNCSKIFKSRQALKQHERATHEENQLYKCGECGKTLLNATVLKQHVSRHKGELEKILLTPDGYEI